jgi:Zn-dependent M28 family amino/carboxypeptidase
MRGLILSRAGIVTLTVVVLGLGLGWAAGPKASKVPVIDAARLLAHVKVLASDAYEGRAPGTRGEDLTVAYTAEQFAKAGLASATAGGNFLQNVPLVGITPDPGMTLCFTAGQQVSTLKSPDGFVAWTKRVVPEVKVAGSDLVFVGYGIQAPEFGWDDFKGVDLHGRTLLVLVGDPPVPAPDNPKALDPKVFGGPAMTYYGRWTYKYEMAARLGAAAVFIVHEIGPAGYPFAVVQGKVGEQLDLVTPDNGAIRAAVEGWLTLERAKSLLASVGQDYEVLKRRALTRDFRPVMLAATASISIKNTIRQVTSHNVAGRLAGSGAKANEEAVVFAAHWDHFGIGPVVDGDRVYHGAVDNATGVAALIELARAYRALPTPPRRSLLFLAVTAEEQNLLGSRYYTEHPLIPLAGTAAMINIDALNVLGRTRDVTVVGLGHTELDDLVRKLAGEQWRVVRPDPQPEKGSFFRSDHFPFAAAGVPFVYASSGVDYVGRPAGWGLEARNEFTRLHYHKPSDVVRPDWDLKGAIEDLQLCFAIGQAAAQSEIIPAFLPASEYKARQEALRRPATVH